MHTLETHERYARGLESHPERSGHELCCWLTFPIEHTLTQLLGAAWDELGARDWQAHEAAALPEYVSVYLAMTLCKPLLSHACTTQLAFQALVRSASR